MLSATDNYIIRNFKPEDRNKIFDLLKIVWGESFTEKLREIWLWKIENNPFKENGISVATVMEKEDRIIGVISKMPAPLKFHEKETKCIWLCEYIVHPDHRGLGHKLMENVMKEPAILLGATNELSYKVVKKLGWSDIYILKNRIYITNLRHILKNKKVGNQFLQFICGKIWNVLNNFLNILNKKKGKNISIEKITIFDQNIDKLWERIEKNYGIIVVRNKEYLNWRYVDRPDINYNIYLAESDKKVLGYVVTRTDSHDDLKFGHIVDIICDFDRSDACYPLINEAVQDFRIINDVDLITCYISPYHHLYDKALRRNGFFFKTSKRQVVFYNNSPSVSKNDISNTNDWFFTRGDSDMDMI